MPDEQIGGVLQQIANASSLTNQLLGQIAEILANAQGIDVSGSIVSSGATAGVGYTTGAGGTVTQASSKSTGVTLNKVTGQITMNNAALNAGVEVSFTVTNSAVAAADVVLASHASGGTGGAYDIIPNTITAGAFNITVSNVSGGNLSEAIVLNFAIFKGATA